MRQTSAGASGQPGSAAAARLAGDSARTRTTPRRVLVVDDNREAAQTLVALLHFLGYEAQAVFSGANGLTALRSFAPHVAIWDVTMPGMDGYEAARQVRRQPGGRHVMLVALTGLDSANDRRAALAAGFDVHLPKPVDVSGLLEVMGTA